ncbi:type II secretion system protein [Sulfurospirillum sp. 1307]|jgi:general secretion pathway protein G
MKKAFTMIELVFVIVVLGILAGVALPRLLAPADDARLVKVKSDISSIRSAISLLKNKNILEGNMTNNGYPTALDDASLNTEDEELFDGNDTIGTLLTYPIYSKNSGGWKKTGVNQYSVNVSNKNVVFTYDSSTGKFDCNTSNGTYGDVCLELLK